MSLWLRPVTSAGRIRSRPGWPTHQRGGALVWRLRRGRGLQTLVHVRTTLTSVSATMREERHHHDGSSHRARNSSRRIARSGLCSTSGSGVRCTGHPVGGKPFGRRRRRRWPGRVRQQRARSVGQVRAGRQLRCVHSVRLHPRWCRCRGGQPLGPRCRPHAVGMAQRRCSAPGCADGRVRRVGHPVPPQHQFARCRVRLLGPHHLRGARPG